jgi:renal tumor antigen
MLWVIRSLARFPSWSPCATSTQHSHRLRLVPPFRHYLPEGRLKDYMYQLLKSMDHMHRNGIFHRDIKPENILVCDDELKLADFGSCRGIYSKQPYTEYISTRWYRAPECLLTDGFYNYKMDMWGVGCVFFEVLSLYPLFPGTNELDQINKIHNVIGTRASLPRPFP